MTDLARRSAPSVAGTWRTPLLIVGFGCLISMISFGPRSALGFFLTPMSDANHWGRDVFAFALALQNLLWGIGQPLAGIIADRFGTVRVLCAGALMFAAGLALMAHATSAPLLDVSAGALIGFGLSGTSFIVVLATFGKLLPPEWRSLAFRLGTAAGSFGQFLYSPLSVVLIDTVGWQQTLLIFAASMLAVLPLSLALATPPVEETKHAAPQSLQQALSEAFAHRSYVLLVLGFFTCGFQLAFITVHLPAYLVDRGLSAQVGMDARDHRALQHLRLGRLRLALRPHAEALSARVQLFHARRRHPRLHLVPGDGGVRPAVRRGDGSRVALGGAPDQRHHRRHVRNAVARNTGGLRVPEPPDRGLPRRLARRPRIRAHRLL
jgi:MFS family permease